MCGIAGVIELEKGRVPSVDRLRHMADTLTHRGPDEEGVYQTGSVGLVHRRLSIIDLASGQQPMLSPDGNVAVVFNGEIYNYQELQEDLRQHGHAFRTRSDTEVLLTLYLQYGLDAFAKINGMLACAFWDDRSQTLILARDRFGKKPLFYMQTAERFLFSSEIKALLAYGEVERQVHLPALHEYLTHSYIVGENSILAGIRRVPPAHLLVFRREQVTCQPYWTLQFQPATTAPEENEVLEHLEVLLEQAVKRRLMSEVPLGAFLSGGIDSSTVVALMARLMDTPVKTFSVGFEEASYSELEDARLVAQHLGTDHHEIIVKPSAVDILPHLVKHLDEPFGDSSAVPTFYVCQAAKKHVTVAISGDAGDEGFAGYRRYLNLCQDHWFDNVPTRLRHGVLLPLTKILPFTWLGWNTLYAMGRTGKSLLPYGLGLYPHIQEQLYTDELHTQLRTVDPYRETERILAQVVGLDAVSQYQYLDTLQYLPHDILTKVDRMSMANSLEVRSPLLDYILVEYLATLPVSLKLRNGISKYILRKFCSKLLPSTVLTKQKQGFAIPKGLWFQKELRGMAEDILLDRTTLGRGYFRKDTLQRLLRHHATGRRDYSTWIWCLIILELWFRLFLDGPTGPKTACDNEARVVQLPGTLQVTSPNG
ncbi:MAG: asparagine synthase (glutamine-hydrolyzing) [Candidatus Binatia bacterium]